MSTTIVKLEEQEIASALEVLIKKDIEDFIKTGIPIQEAFGDKLAEYLTEDMLEIIPDEELFSIINIESIKVDADKLKALKERYS